MVTYTDCLEQFNLNLGGKCNTYCIRYIKSVEVRCQFLQGKLIFKMFCGYFGDKLVLIFVNFGIVCHVASFTMIYLFFVAELVFYLL